MGIIKVLTKPFGWNLKLCVECKTLRKIILKIKLVSVEVRLNFIFPWV